MDAEAVRQRCKRLEDEVRMLQEELRVARNKVVELQDARDPLHPGAAPRAAKGEANTPSAARGTRARSVSPAGHTRESSAFQLSDPSDYNGGKSFAHRTGQNPTPDTTVTNRTGIQPVKPPEWPTGCPNSEPRTRRVLRDMLAAACTSAVEMKGALAAMKQAVRAVADEMAAFFSAGMQACGAQKKRVSFAGVPGQADAPVASKFPLSTQIIVEQQRTIDGLKAQAATSAEAASALKKQLRATLDRKTEKDTKMRTARKQAALLKQSEATLTTQRDRLQRSASLLRTVIRSQSEGPKARKPEAAKAARAQVERATSPPRFGERVPVSCGLSLAAGFPSGATAAQRWQADEFDDLFNGMQRAGLKLQRLV
ncbi:hypothetical protein DIPPA_04749 [Diplonema papillatum]|nr:hypothetical protein DIPPA_04749 [Diplonema papillatum]|eukprot:gene11094-17051_t